MKKIMDDTEKERFMENHQITETQEYLTFHLGKEQFAFEIMKVREVLKFSTITDIPQTPPFMKGVINLRGAVVPVIGVRSKFGMPEEESPEELYVIIIEVLVEGEMTVLGALVDSVKEVIELSPDRIEPPPQFGTGLKTKFIKGMGKYRDDFIIILDIERLFTLEEMDVITTRVPPEYETPVEDPET